MLPSYIGLLFYLTMTLLADHLQILDCVFMSGQNSLLSRCPGKQHVNYCNEQHSQNTATKTINRFFYEKFKCTSHLHLTMFSKLNTHFRVKIRKYSNSKGCSNFFRVIDFPPVLTTSHGPACADKALQFHCSKVILGVFIHLFCKYLLSAN